MTKSKNKQPRSVTADPFETRSNMIEGNNENKERPATETNNHSENLGRRSGLKKTSVVMESDVQKHIGRCLQEAYGELVSEPVPDYLIKLLDDLAAKDKSK